jgi:hypothetical protein
MLQVHNELTRDKEIRDEHRKKLAKTLSDEEKKKGGKKVTSEQQSEIQAAIDDIKAKLDAHDAGAPIPLLDS